MFGNPCKLLGNANTALWIERGKLLLDCRPTSVSSIIRFTRKQYTDWVLYQSCVARPTKIRKFFAVRYYQDKIIGLSPHSTYCVPIFIISKRMKVVTPLWIEGASCFINWVVLPRELL